MFESISVILNNVFVSAMIFIIIVGGLVWVNWSMSLFSWWWIFTPIIVLILVVLFLVFMLSNLHM